MRWKDLRKPIQYVINTRKNSVPDTLTARRAISETKALVVWPHSVWASPSIHTVGKYPSLEGDEQTPLARISGTVPPNTSRTRSARAMRNFVTSEALRNTL